jgi:predicted metalloprotease with PDZ domain
MNISFPKSALAVLMAAYLSIAPALAESPVIKGVIQRDNVIQENESQAESGSADEKQPIGAEISKELREKTFLLQNSQSSAQLGVQQQSPLQAKANGGEEIYGCLGALLNMMNGAILKVFPQSDLNRFDVQPGDRIVGVNGHRYDFRTIIKEMIGTPGTIIELDIRTRNREVRHLQVRRTDARLLPQTGMYKQLTQRNRFW